MRRYFPLSLICVCVQILFFTACSGKPAELLDIPPVPTLSSTPAPVLATSTPEAPPTPAPTPTPALIEPPAARFLPGGEDLGADYLPVENQVARNLAYFDQLPIPKENLGMASFDYHGSNDLTGAQDGIYMRTIYWVGITDDEDTAKFLYQMSRSDQFLKQAFVVIMPSSMQQTMGEVIKVDPGRSVCDDIEIGTEAFDLFVDYRNGRIPTRVPSIDEHSQWYKSEQVAKFPPDLYIYASCRVKNALVLFWGWTMNNYDGSYTPLPADVVAEQVNHHFEMVIQKLK